MQFSLVVFQKLLMQDPTPVKLGRYLPSLLDLLWHQSHDFFLRLFISIVKLSNQIQAYYCVMQEANDEKNANKNNNNNNSNNSKNNDHKYNNSKYSNDDKTHNNNKSKQWKQMLHAGLHGKCMGSIS